MRCVVCARFLSFASCGVCVCVRMLIVCGDDCSDQLRQNYNLKKYSIEITLEHLSLFDEELANRLMANPNALLPQVRYSWSAVVCCLSVFSMLSIVVVGNSGCESGYTVVARRQRTR